MPNKQSTRVYPPELAKQIIDLQFESFVVPSHLSYAVGEQGKQIENLRDAFFKEQNERVLQLINSWGKPEQDTNSANDEPKAKPRTNHLKFVAKRMDGTQQFAIFRSPTCDEIVMNVGNVITNFEKNFRKAMQIIPQGSKQKAELKIRKRDAMEAMVAYGDAAVTMQAEGAAKPRRIMRHYTRVKRVLAKAAL